MDKYMEEVVKKYLITRKYGCFISAVLESEHLVQIDIEQDRSRIDRKEKAEKQEQIVELEQTAKLGDIFIGKVKNIVPNIQAAFIEIGEKQKGYLSLEKLKQPIFLNPKKNQEVHQGDELLVQISKEAVKTKPVNLTIHLNFTGRYVVLTYGKTMIGISSKIKEKTERKRLYKLLEPYKNEEYGFILRTNAVNALDSEIVAEIDRLRKEYKKVRQKAEYSACFSCVFEAPEHFITDIRDSRKKQSLEIITDDKQIYERVMNYLESFQPEDKEKLRFYQDSMICLWNLYGLEAKLEKALRQKVWLPSGAYLVIEPTEALTVIDVNSGKAVGKKKDTEAAYYKINLEAAKEIAVQIRLRNLSGVILVDFIDMEEEKNTNALVSFFAEKLAKDPIKANFIDMTALHLAEITRKKVRKPLYEQIRLFQIEQDKNKEKK